MVQIQENGTMYFVLCVVCFKYCQHMFKEHPYMQFK